MAKFRKKALVDAEQWTGPEFARHEADMPLVGPAGVTIYPVRADDSPVKPGAPDNPAAVAGFRAFVETLEGLHALRAKDWIVTNPAGERYNVSDEVFRSTYEPVDNGGPVEPPMDPPPMLTSAPNYPGDPRD